MKLLVILRPLRNGLKNTAGGQAKQTNQRKVILGKLRAKEQIQEYIDRAVRDQQRQASESRKLESETDILAHEFDAEEKAQRHLQLEWEQEYSTVCRETEQLERKSLDQRMKETQHMASTTVAGETNVGFSTAKILASNRKSYMRSLRLRLSPQAC